MNDQKITAVINTPTDEGSEAPVLMVKIGKVTYRVWIHFSSTSRETVSEKSSVC